MQKQKLHIFPLETTFLHKIRAGTQYFDESHYINFDANSIEIRPFKQPPGDQHWHTDIIFKKALATLCTHNMKYLTKLDVSIEASFLFQTSTMRKFSLALAQNFRNLRQVNLRLQSCKNVNGENLQYLLDSLTKRMGHLTEVNIHFLLCADIDDRCLENLKLLIFKRCKQLKKLEVIVSGSYLELYPEKNQYFDPDMDKWLRTCTSYHDVSGSFGATNITSKGAARLCLDIGRYFKKIESMAFEIPILRRPEQMKAEHVAKMIEKLPNLKSLKLSFAANVNDTYLAKVSSVLGQRLRKLQSLSLWFHGDNKQVTDDGLEKLASNIFPWLPQLTYFAFSLSQSEEITDDGVVKFGTSIANHLKNLETLILDFNSSEQLTSTVPSKLTQAFKNSLLSLRKLILNFEWIDGWNCGENEIYPLFLPEKVENLNLYLYEPNCVIDKGWENLRQLSIIIGGCGDDTRFVDMFPEYTQNLKNLTQLKLILSSPNKVTDEKVGDLTCAIGKNLKNLTSLELGFSYCKLLTSKCLLLIGRNLIKNLDRLVHFHLRFYQPKSFDSESLVSLIRLIAERLQELESLTLFFLWVMDKQDAKKVLGSIYPLITGHLRKLKKLTFQLNPNEGYELNEGAQMRQEMRKQLCHIPMLYAP